MRTRQLKWSLGALIGGACAMVDLSLWAGNVMAQEVVVELDQLRQRMDGFGASSAFFGAEISEDDAQWLFSEEDGLGLSLHRVLIEIDATTPELATAQQAYAYGTKIWATAWTPPPEWKTNGRREANYNGELGRLRPENYADYANHLADFVEWMEASGVPVVAVSPQNEPDWEATWDGCVWSPQEMVTFVRDHMGPVFESRGLDTMIAAPDTAFLRELPSFFSAFEADPDALRYLGVVATHPYSTEGFDWTWSGAADNDKPLWQTEISWEAQHGGTPTDTPDPGMMTALWMVSMLHEHVTVLGMNAWNYWAIYHNGEFTQDTDTTRQNPAFIQGGVRFKRGYAMGNYSKFVRPGFMRVAAEPASDGDVLTTAFRSDERVVIVAINNGQGAVSRSFSLAGAVGEATAAVPWITSDNFSLEEQAPVAISGDTFDFSLPGRSVTSLVIDLELPAPVDDTSDPTDDPTTDDPTTDDPTTDDPTTDDPTTTDDPATDDPGDTPDAGVPPSDTPEDTGETTDDPGTEGTAPPNDATPSSTPAGDGSDPPPEPPPAGTGTVGTEPMPPATVTPTPSATTPASAATPPVSQEQDAPGTAPPATGTPAPSGGAGTTEPPTLGSNAGGEDAGCGCTVVGRQNTTAGAWLGALLAVGMVWRIRRHTRSGK